MNILLFLFLITTIICPLRATQVDAAFKPVGHSGLEHLSTGSPAHVWGIDYKGDTVFWNGSAWQKVGAMKLKGISVGSDGSVFALGGTHGMGGREVFRRVGVTPNTPMGTGWRRRMGRMTQLAARNRQSVWAVKGANTAHRWDPKTRLWRKLAGKNIQALSVGADGAVWVLRGAAITGDLDVYQRQGVTQTNPFGVSWKKHDVKLSQISAGNNNFVFGIGQKNKLYTWNGTRWNVVKGMYHQVAAHGTNVWVLAGDSPLGGKQAHRKLPQTELATVPLAPATPVAPTPAAEQPQVAVPAAVVPVVSE